MNREIKFRAWDKDAKRMLAVDAIALAENVFEWGAGITDQHNDFHSMSDVELMQFTGLHDKNSIEIYKDDIVHATGNDTKYVVQFGTYRWGDYGDEFHHGWCLRRVGEIFTEPMGNQQECGEFLTVIGNIHENSENEQ